MDNIYYENLGIDKFSELYGSDCVKLDGKRISLPYSKDKVADCETVITKQNSDEYVIHLTKRLDLFLDTIKSNDLRKLNPDLYKYLMTEIHQIYNCIVASIKVDKSKRITLPNEVIDQVQDNNVYMVGNGNTISLYTNYESYKNRFKR